MGKSFDDKLVNDIEEILNTASHCSEWLRDRDEKQRIKHEKQGIIKVAKNMLLDGANILDIVKCTDLSLEELKSL